MRIKRCSVKQLKKLSSKKNIICFGAGIKLCQFLDLFKDLSFEEKIECILDNNKDKQGSTIELNDKQIKVESPELLKTIDFSQYIIMISVENYKPILAQLQNMYRDEKINVYLFPSVYSKIYQVLEKIIKLLPLKKYILLIYDGATCDNTISFGKYIRDNNFFKRYKLVWFCNNINKPRNTINEKYIYAKSLSIPTKFKDGIEFLWYYGRAKYIIYENQQLEKFREDQISVYLNHGAPPIKATKGLIVLPDTLNYALSPSEFSSGLISEQFSINKERIVICGSPRTDVFFEESTKDKFKNLELDEFNKVILWAPTFRKCKNTLRNDSTAEMPYGIPILQNENDWKTLVKSLEEAKVLLLIKPHKLADISSCKIADSKNLKFVTQEILDELNANVYELMIYTDALITDYSTISFDYMLLDKPIAYTLDDENEYTLGFSVDNPEDLMPGHKIYSINEMMDFIKAVSNEKDDYRDDRNELKRKIHTYTEGESAKRLCSILKIGEI